MLKMEEWFAFGICGRWNEASAFAKIAPHVISYRHYGDLFVL
jgi:hypothetical protein